MKRIKMFLSLLLVGGLVSCGSVFQGAVDSGSATESQMHITRIFVNPPPPPIYAHKNIPVGILEMTNDAVNLSVTYRITNEHFLLRKVQLWVGINLADAPLKKDKPDPGKFPYKASSINASSYTFAVPLASMGITNLFSALGTPFYLLAHSELDKKGGAWSYGVSFSEWTGTKAWGWYSTYILIAAN